MANISNLTTFRASVGAVALGAVGVVAGIGILMGHIYAPEVSGLLIAGLVTTVASGILVTGGACVAKRMHNKLKDPHHPPPSELNNKDWASV